MAFSRAGRNKTRIIRFWILVAAGFGVTSLAGYVVLDTASPRTVAIVLAFAGGAVLTMLANTMMPEALHHGGKLAGFVTTLGFALAFAIAPPNSCPFVAISSESVQTRPECVIGTAYQMPVGALNHLSRH